MIYILRHTITFTPSLTVITIVYIYIYIIANNMQSPKKKKTAPKVGGFMPTSVMKKNVKKIKNKVDSIPTGNTVTKPSLNVSNNKKTKSGAKTDNKTKEQKELLAKMKLDFGIGQ